MPPEDSISYAYLDHAGFNLIPERQAMTAKPSRVPFWRLLHDPSAVAPDIVAYPYAGAGTSQDPYAVTWIPNNDPQNPLKFGTLRKWGITLLVSCCTLSVAFVSSTYTGSIVQVEEEFGIGEEAAIVGLSVFVFGFSVRWPK